ncbi:PhoPQ-activated pathogenicity-related protein [Rosistilla carotiformis]|uniref:PhoPQ-activated pathogenicity-related protein n=1 Tax=Rosistilla carotiformis TaxID=2528017 RepID=A0A518JTD2_9BACT|nr:PhoPQ-activated protein PqaA family protein [Rosistilla carotiformis]QDV68802.1 PhoPQ-activated pathogenicity-related protein [Rosistilla carotiformis]
MKATLPMLQIRQLFLLFPLLCGTVGYSQTATPPQTLADIVLQRDSAYGWQIQHRGQIADCEFLQVQLTSQRWHDVTWRHTLIVIQPPQVDPKQKHALMLIDGGSWRPEWNDDGPGPLTLPATAEAMAMLARESKTPVAIIRQIPFQPMMEGRKEDALIAETLKKYYETGDRTWPLVPAMARAASCALDAITEVAQQEWNLQLNAFTITGASKRGWTTYLLGATDPRVAAIAPMVIDMLNMEPQMEHQLAAWGAYSPQIEDYTKLGLQKSIGTPAGNELMSLIDPYVHREKLTMPKLIILGTNDPYWPLDAQKFYFEDLPQPRALLNIPNNGHGLKDISRMVGSIGALHRSVVNDTPLPTWQSKLKSQAGSTTIVASSDQPPSRVYGWIARAATRDFRQAQWHAKSLVADDQGTWQLPLVKPESGYIAGMIEAQYDGPGTFPLSITTMIEVVPELKPAAATTLEN